MPTAIMSIFQSRSLSLPSSYHQHLYLLPCRGTYVLLGQTMRQELVVGIDTRLYPYQAATHVESRVCIIEYLEIYLRINLTNEVGFWI